MVSFNPPVAIICSCKTKYFPPDLSFENNQFIYHIFLKYPCFRGVSYYIYIYIFIFMWVSLAACKQPFLHACACIFNTNDVFEKLGRC
jgi:hypothetical protein